MGAETKIEADENCLRKGKKQIKRSAVPWNYGAQPCDLGGTQTHDIQNRNLMLYSTELRGHIPNYRFAKVNNIFAITKFSP